MAGGNHDADYCHIRYGIKTGIITMPISHITPRGQSEMRASLESVKTLHYHFLQQLFSP